MSIVSLTPCTSKKSTCKSRFSKVTILGCPTQDPLEGPGIQRVCILHISSQVRLCWATKTEQMLLNVLCIKNKCNNIAWKVLQAFGVGPQTQLLELTQRAYQPALVTKIIVCCMAAFLDPISCALCGSSRPKGWGQCEWNKPERRVPFQIFIIKVLF